jgi:hypothetical protein
MKVGRQYNFIPRTEHVIEVVKLAYIDASIVSQERLGALCVGRTRVANLHTDRIGLRRRVIRTPILHKDWRGSDLFSSSDGGLLIHPRYNR